MARKKKEEGNVYKGSLDFQKNAKKIVRTNKLNRYQVSGDNVAGEVFLPNDVVEVGDIVVLKVKAIVP